MSSIRPERDDVPGAPASAEVAPGVRLRLLLPEPGREQPEVELPRVDLSAIAGARVTLRRGVEGAAGIRLRALCATAPSDRWAPGVEDLVLDRASALARTAAPGPIERWEIGPLRSSGAPAATAPGTQAPSGDAGAPSMGGSQRFEQAFQGVARGSEGDLAVRGRHLLAFAGEERAALLCTVLCAEPGPRDGAAARCAPLVDAAVFEGALAPAPSPSLMVRGVLLAAEHPRPAAALLVALAALAVALLLARRPRRPAG